MAQIEAASRQPRPESPEEIEKVMAEARKVTNVAVCIAEGLQDRIFTDAQSCLNAVAGMPESEAVEQCMDEVAALAVGLTVGFDVLQLQQSARMATNAASGGGMFG